MATMRETWYELLKAKWKEFIKENNKSGISIRMWCENHQIFVPSFFCGQRVIFKDLLINAGTMMTNVQIQFSEIASSSEDSSQTSVKSVQ